LRALKARGNPGTLAQAALDCRGPAALAMTNNYLCKKFIGDFNLSTAQEWDERAEINKKLTKNLPKTPNNLRALKNI
jgi:hypothetical protein